MKLSFFHKRKIMKVVENYFVETEIMLSKWSTHETFSRIKTRKKTLLHIVSTVMKIQIIPFKQEPKHPCPTHKDLQKPFHVMSRVQFRDDVFWIASVSGLARWIGVTWFLPSPLYCDDCIPYQKFGATSIVPSVLTNLSGSFQQFDRRSTL